MQLVSVNVGTPQPIKGKSGMSGIFKQPTLAPVRITQLGLANDAIIDVENHGGIEQAVYIFGTPDFEWWEREVGRSLTYGSTFGENLTFTELVSADYNIGDRFQVGAVLLEVTSPRIPCVTLASRMGDPKFVKRFARAERFGLYCRVLEVGSVCVGDPVTIEHYQGETISALEMFRLFYTQDYDEAILRRALKSPLHFVTRIEYEERLAEMTS
ncbi:MAG: MOSC domain-containing protein [Chloroflexota bacterium]